MAHGRFDNPIIAALAGVKDFFRKQSLTERLKDTDDAKGKTIVITGANSGLGFGLSKEFARRDGKVIMACRSQIPQAGEKVKKLTGTKDIEMRFLDLSKIETIHSFCESLEKDEIKVDILILNAGVALPTSRKTESGLEEMFLVNYLANAILVSRLLSTGVIPNSTKAGNGKSVAESPRIIFVSSDSHQGSSSVDYDQFGNFEEYGITKGMNYYSYYKLILNTYAAELSRYLSKDDKVDVGVHIICPGPVNSNIAKEAPWLVHKALKGIFFIFFKSPETAAKPVVYLGISDDFLNKTMEYMHMFNMKRMDEKVYIEEEGKKLWEATDRLWLEVDPEAARYSLISGPA